MLGGIMLVFVVLAVFGALHYVSFSEGISDFNRDEVYRNAHRGTFARAYDAGWERQKREQILLQENIERLTEEGK